MIVAEQLAREQQFRIIETVDLDLADGNVTADFVNRQSAHEPLATRGTGRTHSEQPYGGYVGRSPTSGSRSSMSWSPAAG